MEVPLVLVADATAPVDIAATVEEDGRGLRISWSVRNPGRRAVSLRAVGVRIPVSPKLVLEHGWQSWSPVRVCPPGDLRPDRARAPGWRRALYCADGSSAARRVLGDHFLVSDDGIVGFLSALHHLGTVEVEPSGRVTAWALFDGVSLGPGLERELDPIWVAHGDSGECFAEYADRWASTGGSRLVAAPAGWCSWYRYGAETTPTQVRAQIGPAAAGGLDYLQIDDGWQAAVGDWAACSPRWQRRLGAVADDIRAAGLRAGIWTAPFVVSETSKVAMNHPEWLVHDRRGPVKAMHHPTLWGGWAYALDLTNPAVLEHLSAAFSGLVALGFDVHKVDFLYAGALRGRRHDPSATRAEALRAGLGAIRAAVGDRGFVIACGCPLGPAAGLVDAMRVSPDTSTTWQPAWSAPGFADAAPAGVNAVRASSLRAPLHGRLWLNDPDCLLLRHPGDRRTPAQRGAALAAAATAAPYVTLSDDLRSYEAEDWALVTSIRAAATGPPAPSDPFVELALR
ncbi:MAG TPA: glycoside hydrolase family 36 protein [Acidimicrobiales bacterium]|nr:glycoside hydrolase family 36 protein [Acidimicrobiales bacterium]